MLWIKYCNSNSYTCMANLIDKILHLFPKSVSFNGFAKASEPNKWNKGHLKEGNGVAPLGQMFSQLINHRINASFLKGTCLYCFLVHLSRKERLQASSKHVLHSEMLYCKKTNLFNTEQIHGFADTTIWTSSKFFHFKHIKQQGGHRNEGTSGFSNTIKHSDTPKAHREVTCARYKACHTMYYLGQRIS